MKELVQDVSGALANGVPPNEIVKGLVESGIPQQDAQSMVSDIAQHMQANAQQQGGGGLPGWVIWIGILILFNVLSHVFNWGWILY